MENTTSWVEQVVIRTIREMDLPALEWNGEYIHYRRVYSDAYERSKAGQMVLWIAEIPGTGLLGQLFVQLDADYLQKDHFRKGYIYGFRIKPEFRSSGVGSRMLKTAENDLFRRGYHFVTLNVAKNNPRALDLYKRLGYYLIGEDPGRWSYPDHNGTWHHVEEPAWKMEKSIWSLQKI
jgi:ribosomal protein S18 acetylase RimI-like enzyme